jgi:predicted nucleic acid-binding protein
VTLRPGERPVIDARVAVASSRGHLALAVAIAAELDHAAYDAVYLSVAQASELRFVTADDRLIRKIRENRSRFRHMLVALSEIG